jgi:hypothetical protein
MLCAFFHVLLSDNDHEMIRLTLYVYYMKDPHLKSSVFWTLMLCSLLEIY